MRAARFLACTAACVPIATGAMAQTRAPLVVQPYIEASQILDADLKSGDVLTYSTIAAGVDAATATRRVNAQLSYRYEHRIDWGDDIADNDVHTGLARIEALVAPGLTLEAGAIATRARGDIGGAAPGILTGNAANVSQLYAVYGGPSYAAQTGPLSVNANYRIGYAKVEVPDIPSSVPGQARRDYYDHSLGQVATASVGTRAGDVLPVGLTLSGAYSRESGAQLGQRFEGFYGRGDVYLPVSPYVELTAGVGYERIRVSQRDPLRDAAGAPVLDRNGRYVSDTTRARRIAYDTDGVYYDAGVLWRPNRRARLEGHVGWRYGSVSGVGLVSYQASTHVGFQAQVYDTVTTFGRQLREGLAGLPTSFVTTRDQFAQQFNGCTFGTTGAAPGGCLNAVFQSIATASYRARGVDAILSAAYGPSTYGVGVGYANRRLFVPDLPGGAVAYGNEDESIYGQLFYQRVLSPYSGFDANAFVNWYKSELPGSRGVLSTGATGTYYRNWGRLGAAASVGLYSFRIEDYMTALAAQAQLAARYTF